MDQEKRVRLEAAGFIVGSVAEFLNLTPAESALVETRLALSSALRNRRKAQGISQAALAKRMKSSQSRVTKIEAADPTVSLDLMARAIFETGASVRDLGAILTAQEDNQPVKT